MKVGAMAAALLIAAADLEAQTRDSLTFCVGVDNLPMSAATGTGPTGFEVDLARALAERLGKRARFEWLDPHHDFTEKAVVDGRCDAALGAILEPGGMAGAQPVTGVTLTEPYYRAGYLLIRRPEAPPVSSLDGLRGKRIALEGESLVTYTLRQQGHQVYVLRDYASVVDAVADGRAEYGYLWGPLAASLTRQRSDVVLAEEFQPPQLWSFATAVLQESSPLRQALDGAIRELTAEGVVAEIFAQYGVPYLPPCSSAATGRSCGRSGPLTTGGK
jgi:polar amino acid transport system substrate-binding protein